MAFEYFRRKKVDIAVIETGLGGRLDSTNIIEPIASIITNVAFDHMKELGGTLTKIAGEKAGIIKKGVPVITGARRQVPRGHRKDCRRKRKRRICPWAGIFRSGNQAGNACRTGALTGH